jgi:hypothetical protein
MALSSSAHRPADVQAGSMIREGQARRFQTEAKEDEKLNSVDVSGCAAWYRVPIYTCPGLSAGHGRPRPRADKTDNMAGRDRRVIHGVRALTMQLVTEVDKAVQAFIEDKIGKQYPAHELYVFSFRLRHASMEGVGTSEGRMANACSIGEETYSGQKITDAPTWIGESLPPFRLGAVRRSVELNQADVAVE